jgi:glycolate oxidase iron-sulfur subunit
VVTANPGCILQIQAGLRARGLDLPVLHLVEILDRAYGGQTS